MSLSPEQKQTVASWVAAGDSLSVVQKKLQDEFQVSMTYMDVRFLVDDLDLTLKDPEPQADASDVSKAPPAPTPPPTNPTADGSGEANETAGADEFADGEIAEDGAAPPDAAAGNVSVSVDPVTLLPGALASGTVRFSDGVTGKWIVDDYGRPGFTEVSQPGYQPSPADAQAFMQELGRSLQ